MSVQVLRAGAKSFQLACQEETSSDMTVCALASDWARQTAREVGVIKLKGEVKVRAARSARQPSGSAHSASDTRCKACRRPGACANRFGAPADEL